jgi:hypothetical protein
MTRALLSALLTVAAVALLGALAVVLEPDADLETAYPVSYRACLDRQECR